MFSARQLLQAIREARNDKIWGNSLPARGNIIIMLAIEVLLKVKHRMVAA